jgi:hypothetical protein
MTQKIRTVKIKEKKWLKDLQNIKIKILKNNDYPSKVKEFFLPPEFFSWNF